MRKWLINNIPVIADFIWKLRISIYKIKYILRKMWNTVPNFPLDGTNK